MPVYDSEKFSPPAPVASVTISHPVTGALLSDVLLLMDTGADVTLIPREAIEKLGIEPVPGVTYELQGFDGSIQFSEVVSLELVFLNKKFKGQYLVIDEPIGILGRNVLNAVSLVYHGPNLTWNELKK